MSSFAVLFSVLACMAHAAPLPMPAAKQGLTARYYGNSPIVNSNPPCWINNKQGILKDLTCGVADVEVTKRSGAFGWFHLGPARNGDRCWQDDREGVVQDLLCVTADLTVNKRGLVDGLFTEPYYGPGHSFGWYHPGPFVNGDKCTQDGVDGLIEDALCVVADVQVSKRDFDTYFPFGWFHAGPFAEGDQCWQNGAYGQITNSLCAVANINLDLDGRNHPDWREPYFGPGYSFGWFHRGQFKDGDSCWQDGRFGTISDALCVVADLDIDLKRGLTDGLLFVEPYYGPGHSFGWFHPGPYVQGDRCYRNGQYGLVRGTLCAVVDVKARREFLGEPFVVDDPVLGRGVVCQKDGQEGILRDAVCVIANVEVSKRQDEGDDADDDIEESADGSEDDPSSDAPDFEDAKYDDDDNDGDDDKEKSEKRNEVHDELLSVETAVGALGHLGHATRGFLLGDGQYADNFGGADGYDGYYRDALHRGDRFVDGVTRLDSPGSHYRDPLADIFIRHHDDLVGGEKGSVLADTVAKVGLENDGSRFNREHGDRKILGDLVGRGVAFTKRAISGLSSLDRLHLTGETEGRLKGIVGF